MYYINHKLMEQTYFNYNLKPNLAIEDYFVGISNKESYNILIKNSINNNFFLYGPNKSGKTHLGLIWKNKFNALKYDNNLDEIIHNKRNVLIDDIFINIIEEDIFHLINHCNLNNLKLLVTSHIFLNEYIFEIEDLSSRLKTFINISIELPDDELLINLMIKLFRDKQIIIKNYEILHFILKRVHRSYKKIFLLIEKIDRLSLKQKRQLTIPLIKELI